MASEINKKDIISDEALKAPWTLSQGFKDAIKNLDALITKGKALSGSLSGAKSINDLNKSIKDLNKNQKALDETQKAVTKSAVRVTEQHMQEIKTLNSLIEKREKLRQGIKNDTEAQKQMNKAYKSGAQDLAEYSAHISAIRRRIAEKRAGIIELNREVKTQLIMTQLVGNEYKKLSVSLDNAKRKYKDLLAGGTATSQQLKAQEMQVRSLSEKLNSVNKSVASASGTGSGFGAAIGGAGGMLRSFLGAFGLVGGMIGFFNVLKNGIEVTAQYQYKVSELQAVLGVSYAQTRELRKQQLELGKSTVFAASKIADLHIELAKLGFPVEDIKKMTKSTLDASLALGSDLARQAALTGAALKIYGLRAEEAARVNDVMAKAAAVSALDFRQLEVALPIVGSSAARFGFTIEETVALLAELSNAGLDASMAATATRNIFLHLADATSDLSKAIKTPVYDLPSLITAFRQLNMDGIDLGKALELTDKRAVNAFSTLLRGTSSVEKIGEVLKNAAGAATDMATVMGDNLIGDTNQFKASWEALILSLTEGDSWFNRVSRSIVQTATAFFRLITPTESATEELKKQHIEVNAMVGAITSENISNEARIGLLRELSVRYPELTKDIDINTVTNEELAKSLKIVNEEMIKTIAITQAREKLEAVVAKQVENRLEEQRLRTELETEKLKPNRDQGTGLTDTRYNTLTRQLEHNRNVAKSLEEDFYNVQRAYGLITEQYDTGAKKYRGYEDIMSDALTKEQERAKAIADANNRLAKSKVDQIASDSKAAKETADAEAARLKAIQDRADAERTAHMDLMIYRQEQRVEKTTGADSTLAEKKRLEELKLQRNLFDMQTAAEGIKIYEEYLDAIDTLEEEHKVGKVTEASEEFTKEGERKLQDLIDSMNAEIAVEQSMALKVAQSKEQAEKKILDIKKKYAVEAIKVEIETAKKIIEISNLAPKEKEEAYAKLKQLEVDLGTAMFETLAESGKSNMEVIDDFMKRYRRHWELIAEGLQALGDLSTQRQMANIDAQQKAFNEGMEKQKVAFGNNEKGKEVLETRAKLRNEQFERERLKLKQRAAKFDKASALAQATINVAMAITSALAAIPPRIGLAFLFAAVGGAQVAAIAGQPLPQYAKGTKSAKGGLSIVGERGVERVTEPGGNSYLTSGKATLMNIPKGSTVETHADTMKALAYSSLGEQAVLQRENKDYIAGIESSIREGNRQVVDAIVNNAPGDLYTQGTEIMEVKRLKDGNKALVRKKSFG